MVIMFPASLIQCVVFPKSRLFLYTTFVSQANASKPGLGSTLSSRGNKKIVNCSEYLGINNGLATKLEAITPEYCSLRQRVSVLEECGLPVNDDNVQRFLHIYKADLNKLIEEKIIKDPEIVYKNVLKYLQPFKFDFRLRLPSQKAIADNYKPIKQYHRRILRNRETIDGWPESAEEEKANNIAIVYKKVLRQYYNWRLEADYYTIDKVMYINSKFTGVRSVRSVKQTLDILEDQLGLAKQKIIRNFFLVSITPERLDDVLKVIPNAGTVAERVPKILAKNSCEIRRIQNLLMDSKIKDDASLSYYKLFTYNSATIEARIRELKNSEFSVYLQHPRICELIYFFTKAKARSKEIKSREYKCVSLNILVANETVYQRFLNEGVDKYMTVDMTNLVSEALGGSKEAIAEQLNRHPSRYFVPLQEVKCTMEALLDAGFKNDAILEAVPILLYPRDKVLATLDSIPKNKDLKIFGLENGFVTHLEQLYNCGAKSKDRRLQICLYFMEKPFHFTGEGALRIGQNVEKAE